ncbi:hypothetical protein KUH03_05765 [Sphingobacterium sp. E70]|uniref:hypothetical protein n=1 Tax=Sphingobacterium sp. E70 TaxID=2853439 RepID=UPI00211B94D2|nr:hypothetical protein [Sphingobacterium sp. E70]ULT26413.1 hypothetical protein KUH03_05765 [Sphingobacterium sp. E70]
MKTLFANLAYFLIPIASIAQENYDIAQIPGALKSRAVATVRNDKTVVEVKSLSRSLKPLHVSLPFIIKTGITMPLFRYIITNQMRSKA